VLPSHITVGLSVRVAEITHIEQNLDTVIIIIKASGSDFTGRDKVLKKREARSSNGVTSLASRHGSCLALRYLRLRFQRHRHRNTPYHNLLDDIVVKMRRFRCCFFDRHQSGRVTVVNQTQYSLNPLAPRHKNAIMWPRFRLQNGHHELVYVKRWHQYRLSDRTL
jgi:hypothetical protein